MKHVDQITLAIINSSISDSKPNIDSVSSTEWESIFEQLRRGKLIGITYDTVSQLPEELLPNKEMLWLWKKVSFSIGMRQLIAINELNRIVNKAKEINLHLIFFKGIPLAHLYPRPNMRDSSDADIFVAPEDRERAENILVELGYQHDLGCSKNSVQTYTIENGSRTMCIELHTRLWEDYTSPQTIYLDSLHITSPENLITTTACGIEVSTLNYMNHLVYQIFHVVKHFVFEGLPLRYLADLTLYINTYKEFIDFDIFWEHMCKLKYDLFTVSLLQFCMQYLGMADVGIPGEYKDVKITETFSNDLMCSGQFINDNEEHWLSLYYLLPYYSGERSVSASSKIGLQTYFPSAKNLNDNFSYAKKHPILLPIAWCHRFINAIKYTIYCKKHSQSASKAVSKYQYRLGLMSQLGLVRSDPQKK